MIPLEMCDVPAGQFMKRQIPKDKKRDFLAFSMMKPGQRLASIRNGFNVSFSLSLVPIELITKEASDPQV